MLRLLVALATLALVLVPRPSEACASCACGDPTLTALGAEQPFQGRVRVWSELRYRTDRTGASGVDAMGLAEWRNDVGIAWAPASWLFLSLNVPLLTRAVQFVDLSQDRGSGIGDSEVRAKFYVWKDREFAPDHLVSLVAGLKLPTGSVRVQSGTGLPLSSEAQPGSGTLDPIGGLAYSYFGGRISGFASGTFYLPIHARGVFQPGPSLRTTLAGQVQAHRLLAVRLGADTRLDSRAKVEGTVDPHSGGFIAFASPELLLSPVQDWTFYVQARVPVLNLLQGVHREGPFWGAGVTVDL